MNIIEAIISVYANYATWRGRATRSEFWLFNLFFVLALFFLLVFLGRDGLFLTLAFYMLSIIPMISVTVRRLHDTNLSGWWYWICFVPFGALFLFFLLVLLGESNTNDYGEDPRRTWY
jgi:uncharacterized membrane protein YhaH (DUF805 family)